MKEFGKSDSIWRSFDQECSDMFLTQQLPMTRFCSTLYSCKILISILPGVAPSRKEAKYADLGSRHIFEPIAVETLGVSRSSACLLLNESDKRISANTDESRETGFLFQRASVLVQRFNAILLHDILPAAECTD